MTMDEATNVPGPAVTARSLPAGEVFFSADPEAMIALLGFLSADDGRAAFEDLPPVSQAGLDPVSQLEIEFLAGTIASKVADRRERDEITARVAIERARISTGGVVLTAEEAAALLRLANRCRVISSLAQGAADAGRDVLPGEWRLFSAVGRVVCLRLSEVLYP